MKLNLGAGDDRREGYCNVDLRPEGIDVQADVCRLPFAHNSASHVLALDVLEHIPAVSSLSTLREWYDVLIPGGRLTLRVPNLYQLSRWIVEDFQTEAAIVNVYGGHRWGPDGAWDAHHTGWVPAGMFGLLGEIGFEEITSDLALNMTFEARKPDGN